MAWYWYFTGVLTTLFTLSAIVNVAIIAGALKIETRRQITQKMHVLYNWADDSKPISRVG